MRPDILSLMSTPRTFIRYGWRLPSWDDENTVHLKRTLQMRIPIAKMSRKQLLRELPKRMVVLIAFLMILGLALSAVASLAIQSGFQPLWVALSVAAIFVAPLGFARVSRWTFQPAEERARRRREARAKALKGWSFPGGDSRV